MGLLDIIYANPVQFANQAGLYALLSIIPLIIIYLLRPRPKKIRIPSLMFLLDIEKKKRLNIFRKFLKDPLFLIQLFVLTLIALAVAVPFIMASEEAGGGSTVIILDASASMQADGKFAKAVEQASNNLGARNTIILAESVPVMLMKEAPSSSASDALKKLKAKATSSDISSAILLGRRSLPEGGRMVVYSDFISWSGDDPSIARKLAEANGIIVEFTTISGRTDNIGIVNGWFEPGGDYKIVIKNFNDGDQNVRIDVTTDDRNVLSQTRNINGRSSEYFAISSLNPGTTKISIDTADALSVDNNAYLIIPQSIKRDILFITDNAKSPSAISLGLIPFTTVTRAGTRNIPSLSGYSTVFVSGQVLPEAQNTLSDYVSKGGTAVILASPNMTAMEMLPVELDSLSNRTSLNVILPSMITSGIDIEKIEVKKHFKGQAKRGAVTLVEGGDKSAMLSYWKFGRGIVIYSGLADPEGVNIYDPLNELVWNDFHTRPEYPLFFKQLLEWISGSLDVSEYNARTGMFIKLPARETVKTPGDTVTTDVLLLDEVGIYELSEKDVAVNLFDEKESNLAGSISAAGPDMSAAREVSPVVQVIRKPKNLDVYLIMAAMFLVFLELYYLRWRGEL